MIRHGTKYCYDEGCRCDRCTAAARDKRRAWRDRQRANSDAYRRELARARELKRRKTGTCVDCGATTRYAGHATVVSERCHKCACKRNAQARIGTGPMQRRALALIDGGTVRYSAIRDALGVSSGYSAQLINRLLRNGLIERTGRGMYRRTVA